MVSALDALLRATSRDDVLELGGGMVELTTAEQAKVAEVLDAGVDDLAVANLLMSPAVLPSTRRVSTILEHLRGAPDSYLTLAAVVGAEQLGADEFVERQDALVAAELLELADVGRPHVTARRASVAIVRYARSAPFEALVELLNSDDDTIHHNALAAIIAAVGLQRAADLLRARAGGDGISGRDARDLVAVEAALQLEDDEAQVADVVMSQLSYIPDPEGFLAGD